MQLGARNACACDGRRPCAALCAANPIALLRMPRLRAHLLGGDALAAPPRSPAGTVRDVLRRLVAGELTEDEALAELRTQQLDELEGRARLDLGRYLRRGIPEVVLATGKSPREAARLAIAMAERQRQGLISRMTADHQEAGHEAAQRAGFQVIRYAASARVLRPGYSPESV